MVTSRKIDLKRLMARRAFIEDTIDNYSLSVSNDEIVAYKNAEQTHKKDWCREADPNKNYVYVSGHTHRNFFHDDGEYRVYSDNQVGYHSENPHLKTFLLDNDYAVFKQINRYFLYSGQLCHTLFYSGRTGRAGHTRNVELILMQNHPFFLNEYFVCQSPSPVGNHEPL